MFTYRKTEQGTDQATFVVSRQFGQSRFQHRHQLIYHSLRHSRQRLLNQIINFTMELILGWEKNERALVCVEIVSVSAFSTTHNINVVDRAQLEGLIFRIQNHIQHTTDFRRNDIVRRDERNAAFQTLVESCIRSAHKSKHAKRLSATSILVHDFRDRVH